MPPPVVRGLLELLAPERCLACRRRAEPPWCAVCAAGIRPLRAGCRRCAAARGRVHHCWPPGVPIAETVAAHDYRGAVARAVVTAKLTGAHAGWRSLAVELARRVEMVDAEVDAVTWVTTAPARRRRRGVDHAEVLARTVAEHASLPAVCLLEVRPGRDGRDRYVATRRLPGTELLLVDDVLTTGATALRAATALTSAGAGTVRLAVLARAGTHVLTAGSPPMEPARAAGGVTTPRDRSATEGEQAGLDSSA